MFLIYLLRILFGYPSLDNKCNGIMISVETIAGG